MQQGKQGFTLIELLVVVLIIGILAAVALPQYTKAVEKSKATQALTLLKSVSQAAAEYYLANGEMFTSFDDLSVEIPWTGNQSWAIGTHIRDTRSNAEWSLQWYNQNNGNSGTLFLGRIDGKYKGAGFMLVVIPTSDWEGTIYCAERTSSGGVPFEATPGTYCKEIMKGTQTSAPVAGFALRTYALP